MAQSAQDANAAKRSPRWTLSSLPHLHRLWREYATYMGYGALALRERAPQAENSPSQTGRESKCELVLSIPGLNSTMGFVLASSTWILAWDGTCCTSQPSLTKVKWEIYQYSIQLPRHLVWLDRPPIVGYRRSKLMTVAETCHQCKSHCLLRPLQRWQRNVDI